jgi:hypothetical protein
MMDYHGQIMNLPSKQIAGNIARDMDYQLGHLAARHAAAELALQADAELTKLRTERDELARLLAEALPYVQSSSYSPAGDYRDFGKKAIVYEAKLAALCDKITAALLAASVVVKK